MKKSLLAFAFLFSFAAVGPAFSGSCQDEYVAKVAKMKKNHKWRVLGTVSIAVPVGVTLLASMISTLGPIGVIPGLLTGGPGATFSYYLMAGIPVREAGIQDSLELIEQLNRDRAELNRELREAYIQAEMRRVNSALQEWDLPLQTRAQIEERVKNVVIKSHVEELLDTVNKKRIKNALPELTYDEMKTTLLETEETENYLCRHSWRGPISYPYHRLVRMVKNGLSK